MKRIALLKLLFLVCFNSLAQTHYPSGVSNCIARWNFKNTSPVITTVADVSGNSHNGAATNVLTARGFRGRAGDAMKFNGMNSSINVPHAPSLNPTDITIVSVVKASAFYSGAYQFNNIIYKGYNYYIPGSWSMHITDDKFDNNQTTFYPDKQQLDFSGSSVGSYVLPSGNYIDTGKWYFLAITFNGNTVTRYQVLMDSLAHNNNVPIVTTSSLPYALGANTYDVFIGATQQPTYPYWFNGDMDEVVLFNRALSRNEIQVVYDYLWEVFSISPAFTRTTLCQAGHFDLPFVVKANAAFGAGNSIVAQLSDASGNFASPTIIGTVTATTSGSIPCIIPASTPLGSGYRIRLMATSPLEYAEVLSFNISVIAPAPAPVVSITANPGTNITMGQLVTFTAAIANGGATPLYQWRKNGTNIVGATQSTYATNSIIDGDLITVRVSSSMDCALPDTAVSNVLVMKIASGITGTALKTGLALFPNPNNGSFTIKGTTSDNRPLLFEIRDMVGQLVYKGSLSPTNNQLSEMITLPPPVSTGIYAITMLADSDRKQTRLFTVVNN